MKLIRFVLRIFPRRKNRSSLFSSAFSEGAKDTFKEMGYRFADKHKKQKFNKSNL